MTDGNFLYKNVSVYEIEQKRSKKGQSYWSMNTSRGKIQCFDADIGPTIIKGSMYDMDINIRGEYVNCITAQMVGQAAAQQNIITQEDKPDYKLASMAISYAKDLTCAKIITLEQMHDTAKAIINSIKELQIKQSIDNPL